MIRLVEHLCLLSNNIHSPQTLPLQSLKPLHYVLLLCIIFPVVQGNATFSKPNNFCEDFWVELNSVFWLESKGWFFSQSSFSLEEKVKIPLTEVCEADWLHEEINKVIEKVPVGRNASM